MQVRETSSFTIPLPVHGNDATYAAIPEQVIDDMLRCFFDRFVEILHTMSYLRGSIVADVVLGVWLTHARKSGRYSVTMNRVRRTSPSPVPETPTPP